MNGDFMHEKSTSMTTVCRLLLRELRQERNMQQAQIAQMLGKTASTWSKVESGDTPLTLEHLLTACAAMQIWPANFMVTAQNYVALFTQKNWFVSTYGAATPKDEDALWLASDEFYAGQLRGISIQLHANVLGSPWPYAGAYSPLPVFDAAIYKYESGLPAVMGGTTANSPL